MDIPSKFQLRQGYRNNGLHKQLIIFSKDDHKLFFARSKSIVWTRKHIEITDINDRNKILLNITFEKESPAGPRTYRVADVSGKNIGYFKKETGLSDSSRRSYLYDSNGSKIGEFSDKPKSKPGHPGSLIPSYSYATNEGEVICAKVFRHNKIFSVYHSAEILAENTIDRRLLLAELVVYSYRTTR